jgi:hypothetical protein
MIQFFFRILLVFSLLGVFNLRTAAQTILDARLFGQDMKLGSARFHGMSGSMGALGGNTSAIAVNPAGVGIYRDGEAAATLGVTGQGFESTHYGNPTMSSFNSAKINQFALVFSNDLQMPDWKYFNVAFSYNRRNSFDFSYNIEGENNQSTKLDLYMQDILSSGVFVEDIVPAFPFGAGLAWDVLLIDTLNGQYYHALESYGITQKRSGTVRGGVGDFLITGGGNYQDKLYIGGSLGISSLNYKVKEEYSETPLASNTNTQVQSWTERTELDISGRGINLKLGFLYWFTEKVRAGLAYNSGTNFLFNERYKRFTNAKWKNSEGTSSESPNGYNEYRYRTPYNLVASFALVDKYIGSVNLDAELVTYGRMKFNSINGFPIDFDKTNEQLKQDGGASLNLRLGGELLFGNVLLRGGTALYGNPQKHSTFFNRYSFSGGFGYRLKHVMFDVSYAWLGSEPFQRNIHFNESLPLEPSTQVFQSQQLLIGVVLKFKKEG